MPASNLGGFHASRVSLVKSEAQRKMAFMFPFTVTYLHRRIDSIYLPTYMSIHVWQFGRLKLKRYRAKFIYSYGLYISLKWAENKLIDYSHDRYGSS